MKGLLVYSATQETFWSFKHVLRSLLAKRRLDLLAAHEVMPDDGEPASLHPAREKA
jgi:hypothetical protein